jgi:hypothetical protein
LRVGGVEVTAIGKGEAIARARHKGTANIKTGIGAKQNAIGVEQK